MTPNKATVGADGKVHGGSMAGKNPAMTNTAQIVTKPDPMARPSTQNTKMSCPGTR